MSKHTPEPWESTLGCVTSIGNHVCSCVDPGRVSNASRIVTCINACAGMADPAAEIAELKRQRDELLAALHDAATSLETIQLRSFGADSYLDDKHSMRAYAGARAAVAREAMGKTKGSAA